MKGLKRRFQRHPKAGINLPSVGGENVQAFSNRLVLGTFMGLSILFWGTLHDYYTRKKEEELIKGRPPMRRNVSTMGVRA